MTTVDAGPISLRGHHLVCLQFLHGEGYSLEFVRNILHLRHRFERNGAVVAAGHDDVCAACPRNEGRVCLQCPDTEDHVEDLDNLAYDLLDLRPGDRVSPGDLLDRISIMLSQWQEFACARCPWAEVCAASINLLSRG